MAETIALNDVTALLVSTGLSRDGVLKSTGVTRHLERLNQGQVSRDTLTQYAADIDALRRLSDVDGTVVPVDFWDVRLPPANYTRGLSVVPSEEDEYSTVHRLSQPKYAEYIRFLGRCYRALCEFKSCSGGTAVATALALLRETAGYVVAGHCLEMTACCSGLEPARRAIFLWQQVVTGTNREIPYIHREAYSHGVWGRYNVVEMWRYNVASEVGVDAVWGLTGFADRFIRDATNTNQIEHMTISALAQMVLRLPTLLLNLLEEAEWILRKGSFAASQADKAVNNAVARGFLPLFRVEDPDPACVSLEKTLASE